MTARRWRGPLAVLLLGLVGALGVVAPVRAAPAGGSASVSDTSPEPGQTVTVTATGLLPGRDTLVDYGPDGVRLATPTVGADGGFSVRVQIPLSTYDGRKQIVITALDAAGRFSRLYIDLTVAWPPATAQLSDMSLRPSQVVRISGDRWFPGTRVIVILLPEGVTIGDLTAGSDRRISADLRLPKDLLNGRHGVHVFGRAAGGRMANVKLFPTVTGGVGQAGSFEIPDAPLNPTTSTSSPATSSSVASVTTTARPGAPAADPEDSNVALIALLALCVLLVVVVIIGWLLSADGRHWRRRRGRTRRTGAD